MPKICYVPKQFSAGRLAKIEQANTIIAEFQRQGFDLTLRQLYYQFVSRDLIPNNQREYKTLGDVVNDGRLAGLIDWRAITDRTRNIAGGGGNDDPASYILNGSLYWTRDRWERQPYRVEVWIEKDALTGVVQPICRQLNVPYFSCRGYTSQSEMWAAAQRLSEWEAEGQEPVIFHLGDHDPSGIDMSRDIQARLDLFLGRKVQFTRLALNMDQVERYNPPPNFAKSTDSRHSGYYEQFGDDCWELDALSPTVIADLIRDAVEPLVDDEALAAVLRQQANERAKLKALADRWDDLTDGIGESDDDD